jgi:hypothetical protein
MKTLRDDSTGSTNTRFYLLELTPEENRLQIYGYRRDELDKAAEHYANTERRIQKEGKDGKAMDAVLVSVDSLAALERAYPNYFADTGMFLGLLELVLKPNAPAGSSS